MSGAGDGVVFVTVNYKRSQDTKDFVASLTALDGFDRCRVVIVDNASTPASRAELTPLSSSSSVTVLHAETNRFYWPGAAWALRALFPEPASLPEWIVVCNNDILIEQRDFVERLLELDPAEGAVVGPTILGPDGRDQNPFLLGPHRMGARLFWALYHLHYGVAKALLGLRGILLPLRRRVDPRQRVGRGRVYAVHGAFVCLSRRFFEAGGYLDDGFELYAEELTLAETARRLGVAILYDPGLKVIHRDHGSGRARLNRATYDHHRRGWKYYVRSYGRGETT